MDNKMYLGDSVYVAYEDEMLILTTDNGFGPSNTIYLEPRVYAALIEYVKRFQIPNLKEKSFKRTAEDE